MEVPEVDLTSKHRWVYRPSSVGHVQIHKWEPSQGSSNSLSNGAPSAGMTSAKKTNNITVVPSRTLRSRGDPSITGEIDSADKELLYKKILDITNSY
jgi:hypothetical protein